MSSSRFHAIDRFAGMLVCFYAALIAPSVSAFPIYATQPETRTDFSSQTAPVAATLAGFTDVGPDSQPRQSSVSDSPLADPSLQIFATMPSGTSSSARIEDHALMLEATPVATPPVPGAELESLTIGGMQYSTGLDLGANHCIAKSGIGPCAVIEDAFFDLALAWTPELGRQKWYETVLSRI
jgi:hypothetical protein